MMRPFLFLKKNGLTIAFFVVVAVIFLVRIQPEPKQVDYNKNYQACLRDLEQDAISGLDSLVLADQQKGIENLRSEWQKFRSNLFTEKGIVFLIYEKDSLIFWTDHAPAVENYRKQVCLDNSLARLRNGWFEVIPHAANKFGTKTYLALLLLKNDFSYQNKYLVSEFPLRFGLPSSAKLIEGNLSSDSTTIYNLNGAPLFKIKVSPEDDLASESGLVICCLYLTAILLLVLILTRLVSLLIPVNFTFSSPFILFALLFILRFLMVLYDFPDVWHKTSFYDSRIYGNASSFFFRYLGDAVLNAALLFYFSSYLSSFFKKSRPISKSYFFPFIVILFAFLVSLLVNWLVAGLVQNSHISFRINEVFSLSFYSWIGFLSIGLLILTVYFFSELAAHFLQSKNINSKKVYWLTFTAWMLHVFIIVLIYDITCFPETWFWPLFLLLCFLKFSKTQYSFSYGIPFVILFSLVFGYLFFREEVKKEIETRKIFAQDLSNRQDDIAEHLFIDITRKIKSDNKLNRMVFSGVANSLDIEQRLRQEYFSGYWEKFDILLSLVDSACSPILITDNPVHGNHTYFDDQIEQSGNQTNNDELFYIESLVERPRYIARVKIKSFADTLKKPSVLYVQLEPKLTDNLTGFPELLLDKKVKTNTKLSEYSIGIYKNAKLIGREGKFNYPSVIDWDLKNEITFRESEGYNHLINTSGTTQVILSKQYDFQRELITFFTFFFTLFSLLLFIILVADAWLFRNKISGNSLGARIQLLLVAILLISLFSFGYGTYSMVRAQYENQNIDALEKLSKSVRADVESKLGNAVKLDENYREYATYQLKKVAGIFLSDISIYDLQGNLIASSQPRLFEEGILSRKMNPNAFVSLQDFSSDLPIIFDENIGTLRFKSSYQPFNNIQGKRIGFINLPYFARREQQAKEITMAVSPLVNIYVLLFTAAVLSSLLIANLVIKPLRLLQQRFSNIRFGKKNELITWIAKDEIGSLVDEYNRMVLQLEESAVRLAKSEREGAWREMARQVAHEIKNPLTPMKLSIQQLQRTLGVTSAEELPIKIQMLSAMLIEQIDTLSNIASEFSAFAQMPRTNPELLNVSEAITSCIQLFKGNANYFISFNDSTSGQLQIMADKDQFKRMLTNLIKNAIQAIPQERKGEIQLFMGEVLGKMKLKISDNGSGIPAELHEKIYIPNFSTKSEGMGLGLAMVKNILESMNGKIQFETKLNSGTTFEIEIPIKKEI